MHASLSGGHRTAAAAAYPHQLCASWADIINRECWGSIAAGMFPPTEVPPDPRAVEPPLLNVLLHSLHFQVVDQCVWRRRRHINLLEVATLRRALAWSVNQFGLDTRVPIGVDSLVTCGVANKGRSSRRALNVEWRRAIGIELACGAWGGLHYVPSSLNLAHWP